ncbi:unnamed protein product [Echinostoma caproni]|uniref:Ig-like domain-containing protein n=1 Tax=Echinostoma caproni TaxID=27848 RepID=A0A183A769_9TREM|nr:unnamed protein product [Echinostoma caproni]
MTMARKVAWKLPASVGATILYHGVVKNGFTVLPDIYTLIIDRKQLEEDTDISGIYECMVLAENQENVTETNWFFLRWGVDMFPLESMLLRDKPIIKYQRNIIGSIVAPILVLIGAALIKLFVYIKARRSKSRELDIADHAEGIHFRVYQVSGFYGPERNGHQTEKNYNCYPNGTLTLAERNGVSRSHSKD